MIKDLRNKLGNKVVCGVLPTFCVASKREFRLPVAYFFLAKAGFLLSLVRPTGVHVW